MLVQYAVAAALQMTSPPWYSCANDLVRKNHTQPVEVEVLARRIVEECHENTALPGNSDDAEDTPEVLRTIRNDFERMVREQIVAARASAIKLVR